MSSPHTAVAAARGLIRFLFSLEVGLEKLIAEESEQGDEKCVINLPDIPGEAKTFEPLTISSKQ